MSKNDSIPKTDLSRLEIEKENPMNRISRLYWPSLVLSFVVGGSFLHSSLAHAKRGERGMRGEMKELGLSDEQRAKIKEIRKGGREEGKKLRSELKEVREKLRNAAQSDSSKADLLSLFSKVQEKQQAMARHGFSKAMEIREVLTPDQRKKAGKLLGKFFHERREGMRGHKGPRGDDGDDENEDD
jgi:periplasmic protein CpxP/Spy